MRLFALIPAALLVAACGTSLPKMPAKSAPLPIPAVADGVTEERHVWHDARRQRDVPVTLYLPPQPRTKSPVVIFSHGIGEDRDSYTYLGRGLAARGFLTVHITHAGTDKAVLKRGYRALYRAVKQKENWIARPLDVTFVLDQLATRADADLARVAVVGHSAGAFTAFAVAGLRTAEGATMRDPRVKVIVPMSMPKMDGVVGPDGYDAIDIPVLNLTGTRDTSLIYRTFPRHRRIPFESTHATRQFLITLQGVTHNTFSNVTDRHHDLIVELTAAFLRAWLNDDEAARAWFAEAGTTTLRGTRMTVETK